MVMARRWPGGVMAELPGALRLGQTASIFVVCSEISVPERRLARGGN